MLGTTLHDMPLVTNIRVLLPPRGSPKYQTIERPLLIDKDIETEEVKGKGVRVLKRRRRLEALGFLMHIVLRGDTEHRAI